MASKTIAVTEDVYTLLKRERHRGESFSDVIRRLVRRRGKLSDCAGLWADIPSEEIEEMKRVIAEVRDGHTHYVEDLRGD